jgi:regulator of sigma E protease
MIFILGVVGGLPDFQALAPNEIGQVHPNLPAAAAGLQEGDRIVEANGKPVTGIKHLVGINASRGIEPTEYVVQRGDERLRMTLTPEMAEDSGRPILGITLGVRRAYRTVPVEEAATKAIVVPWRLTVGTFEAIGSLIRRRSTEGVTSVVGMGKMLADSVAVGPQEYIALLIQLSVALGLFNLLPVPALDGGRLAFLGYEVITRRRANEKVEAAVHTVGLLFLLGVLVLVMFRDVARLS